MNNIRLANANRSRVSIRVRKRLLSQVRRAWSTP